MRYCIGCYEANDRNKHAEHSPPPAFTPEIAKEARSYGVSDSEKEQQEQHCLRLIGNGHMKKIPDKNPSKQRPCHYAQAYTLKLESPDHVPDTNGQVNSHFWVFCEHTS
jgi:hypothetical protein